MGKITIKVNGSPYPCYEHVTTIYNSKGEFIKFYFDGWEGTSYKKICELLDLVGVEYFTVINE